MDSIYKTMQIKEQKKNYTEKKIQKELFALNYYCKSFQQ
jgi:hypothetical protein